MRIRYGTAFLVVHVLAVFVFLPGCRQSPERASPPVVSQSAPADWFTERAEAAGLTFVHFNGMSGKFLYPELMAPGVALFDYDNDGDLDVFVVQGRMLGKEEATPQPTSLPLRGRLFRNDLTAGANGPVLHFTDVTAQSGIVAEGYGMGVATGDYNNDGCVDLYVTSLGASQLFKNNCDGTFKDVTKESRTTQSGWSVPAVFFDFDRDGFLDLFVGHYLQYDVEMNLKCYSVAGNLDYCPPHVYRPEASHLLHNNGDGTFSDVTAAAGMTREFGPALGAVAADFDGDGWPDLFVANDSQQNQLWMNQRNGKFKNTALLAGVALSPEGLVKASMGVDAGDFDNDGKEDLIVTELTGQGSDFYVNTGGGAFEDRSAPAGIRLASLPHTGFGVGWLDVDNDGWLDLLAVNGAVTQILEGVARNEPFPLKQPKQLLRNLGSPSTGSGQGGRFEDVTKQAGAFFSLPEVSRGAAFGDLDNDGDTDVVIGTDAGPVRLLVNNIGSRKHWVGLRLVSGPLKRDLVGARVEVKRADGRVIWRRSRADGSYASANDPRVLVGLADSAQPTSVHVIWPDGRTDDFASVAVDRYTTLTQSGK